MNKWVTKKNKTEKSKNFTAEKNEIKIFSNGIRLRAFL